MHEEQRLKGLQRAANTASGPQPLAHRKSGKGGEACCRQARPFLNAIQSRRGYDKRSAVGPSLRVGMVQVRYTCHVASRARLECAIDEVVREEFFDVLGVFPALLLRIPADDCFGTLVDLRVTLRSLRALWL